MVIRRNNDGADNDGVGTPFHHEIQRRLQEEQEGHRRTFNTEHEGNHVYRAGFDIRDVQGEPHVIDVEDPIVSVTRRTITFLKDHKTPITVSVAAVLAILTNKRLRHFIRYDRPKRS